jgi:hypothetical protein
MAIFNSYVSLPEGKPPFSYGFPMVFPFSYGFYKEPHTVRLPRRAPPLEMPSTPWSTTASARSWSAPKAMYPGHPQKTKSMSIHNYTRL